MRFFVTSKDIQNGEPCNGYRCPLALALNRQLPGGPWNVGECELYKAGDSKRTKPVAILPTDMQDFVALYDSERGKTLVQPSEFEIEIR